ncbi:MAG: AAA family ATPase [Pseudomonadota bacterium]
MYAQTFGLQHEPFSIAPDPRYLFMSERHREALAHLLYGLGGGGGFVLLTGEIGTGKTTVCRCFLEQVPADCHVAYIFNPKLTVHELLQSVCDEFGVAHPSSVAGERETAKDCIDPLNAFLLSTHAAGHSTVLVIDEAQNLSAEVLEQLRLLTNLETNERKLLQIILIGQPELRGMLARPELEQLAQRVIARFHLDALTAEETGQYIGHRLAVAGHHGPLPFDRAALRRIHTLSGGVPRRINLLCGRALLGAYATGNRTVDRRIVDKAAGEVFGGDTAAAGAARPGTRPARNALLIAGWAVAAVAIGAGAWTAGRSAAPPPPAAESAGMAVAGARPAKGTPALPASAAQPLAAAGPGMETGMAALLALLPRAEDDAWRAIGPAWGLPAADTTADPCRTWGALGVQCFRSPRTSAALIRQLDRPGFLTLYDDSDRPVYAVLAGIDARNATLAVGGARHTVPLSALATRWRGDFATLWRVPPGYAEKPGKGPSPQWLASQLAAALPATPIDARTGAPDSPSALRAGISRFQLAQGLVPDGRAGPATLMELNRAAHIAEPRLSSSDK